MANNTIEKAAINAVAKFQRRHASIALESALGQYLSLYGREETVARLRSDAEHIEDNA